MSHMPSGQPIFLQDGPPHPPGPVPIPPHMEQEGFGSPGYPSGQSPRDDRDGHNEQEPFVDYRRDRWHDDDRRHNRDRFDDRPPRRGKRDFYNRRNDRRNDNRNQDQFYNNKRRRDNSFQKGNYNEVCFNTGF